MKSETMVRVLCSLIGVAAGLLGALAIEAALDAPGRVRRHIEGQVVELTAERDGLRRELGQAKERESLLDAERASLSDDLGREKQQENTLKRQNDLAIHLAAHAMSDYPHLGKIKAFKVGTLFGGALDDGNLESKDAIEAAIRDRLRDLDIPEVDAITAPEHALLLVTVETTGRDLRIGGSVAFHVVTRDPLDRLIYLHASSKPMLADDWGDVGRQMILALDSLAINFKREWRATASPSPEPTPSPATTAAAAAGE